MLEKCHSGRVVWASRANIGSVMTSVWPTCTRLFDSNGPQLNSSQNQRWADHNGLSKVFLLGRSEDQTVSEVSEKTLMTAGLRCSSTRRPLQPEVLILAAQPFLKERLVNIFTLADQDMTLSLLFGVKIEKGEFVSVHMHK